MSQNKKNIFLTVDFEDYRYNFLRDFNSSKDYYIDEVEKQYWILRNILKKINAPALFYLVGEVADLLSSNIINDISENYTIGSHSLSHLKLLNMSANEIYEDTKKSCYQIEDKFSKKVEHYRAPYFSIDGNENNYYNAISKCGIKYSSSLRVSKLKENTKEIIRVDNYPIIELPLRSIGVGLKRITIIGGTYFRLFPINIIIKLIEGSIKKNFIPMIYLHNYEPDFNAIPIDFKDNNNVKTKMNDILRRLGRSSVEKKLKQLSKIYNFGDINELVSKY